MSELSDLRNLLRSDDPPASADFESVMAFERDDWVTIFKDENSDEGGDLRIAVLLQPSRAPTALNLPGFDFHAGDGRPGFVGRPNGEGGWQYEYEPVGAEDEVPLVFYRYFRGPFPNVVEVAEDFRLFWDLYEDVDQGRFLTTDEVGDTITVLKWDGSALLARKSYLRRYQAARQLALSLQIVVDRRGGAEIAHHSDTNIDVRSDDARFAYHGGSGLSDDLPNFTRLIGKRILAAPAIERCGVWPYEKPAEYESFIIGTDGEGEPILHTCDPDTLANYFGRNPDAPHYLTPVFFERSVFEKYYGNPDRYQIEDAYLRAAGAWGLRMDNALDEHVAVFLGDLGTDLPHREQQYWRSFNVSPPGSISETAFRRSFLGQFYDTDRVEHRLMAAYERLNTAWINRFGWPLFKPLHEADAYLGHAIHVPTNDSFGAFDDQVVDLAKLVIDSLNEAAMVAATEKPTADKGIARLEEFLLEQGLAADICTELRRIQGARSKSGAHRKGGDFDLTMLLSGAEDLAALFGEFLESLIAAFEELSTSLE